MSAGSHVAVHRGLLPTARTGALRDTLARLLEHAGAHGGDLGSRVVDLARRDRRALGAVYDAVRESAAFHALVHAPEVLAVVREHLGTDAVHAPFQHTVFRMDLPTEAFRGFGWHQDHPYNMLSARALTLWTPLIPAGPHNGSIDVAQAASDRLYPVEIRWKRDAAGQRLSGRDGFIPAQHHRAFEDAAEQLVLDVGDVVFFGGLVVHRSGHNPGPGPRLSVQARYGDLFAPEVVDRRWANRRRDGFDTFKALYPDMVALEES
jgi:ectoine hydroxylase-related dioxygenase (phytanoyl-CoA dioxygenase family)